MNPVRAYLDTQKRTASKERLMVMLFQAALRHMRAGADALERGGHTEALRPLGKASEIVETLLGTLDARQAPALTESLGELYAFVLARLVTATAGYDAAAAREAERVFTPIAEAFTEAVAKLERAPVGT